MPRAPIPLVLHERKASWAGQLRPRLAGHPARLVESRSIEDLRSAMRIGDRAIVLVNLADGPERGLEAIAEAALIDADALILALTPDDPAGIAPLARELGATHVLDRHTPPPEVARLIGLWIRLNLGRRAEDGRREAPEDDEDELLALALETADPTSPESPET